MKRHMLACLMMGCLLQAQDFVAAVSSMNFSGLAYSGRTQAPKATLAVLDDGTGAFTKAMRNLMTQEPLVNWELNVRYLGSSIQEKEAAALRAQHGWGGEGRWVYLFGDVVKAHGGQVPTAEGLAALLRDAGYKDLREAQAAFCRLHPDHLEGQLALLELQVRRAVRLMNRVLPERSDVAPKTTRIVIQGAGMRADSDNREQKPIRALTPAEDRQFWDQAANQLAKVTALPGAMEGLGKSPIPSIARFSARMREACRASLPRIEADLRCHPSHPLLWSAWASLASVAEVKKIRPLLASLDVSPGVSELPPEAVLGMYVQECRADKAWDELRTTLLPRWERFQGIMARVQQVLRKHLPASQQRNAFKETWEQTLEPLVEACLQVGDLEAAHRVVNEAMTTFRTKDLPIWASSLALKCGRADLAQRWAALKPPEEAG